MRVPLADGTLLATPEVADDDLVPHLLAASDVLGTNWFATADTDNATYDRLIGGEPDRGVELAQTPGPADADDPEWCC
jgi:hypothetical protein